MRHSTVHSLHFANEWNSIRYVCGQYFRYGSTCVHGLVDAFDVHRSLFSILCAAITRSIHVSAHSLFNSDKNATTNTGR